MTTKHQELEKLYRAGLRGVEIVAFGAWYEAGDKPAHGVRIIALHAGVYYEFAELIHDMSLLPKHIEAAQRAFERAFTRTADQAMA